MEVPRDIRLLLYHTQRPLGEDESGFCHLWVLRPKCGCGGLLFKKRGHKEFTCEKCGKAVVINESDLIANIHYSCPYCKFEGDLQLSWKRNKTGKKAFKFKCADCSKEVSIGRLR